MDHDDQPSWLPLDPAYREPEGHMDRLEERVKEVAWELARTICTRNLDAGGPRWRAEAEEALDVQLALLRSLREVAKAVDNAAKTVATDAGMAGASYPQLGAAWQITRQSARSRWPGVVNTASPPYAPDPVSFEVGGGTGYLNFHADEGGWWWSARAADRTFAEAEATYDTKEEAAAHCGAYLLQHTAPANEQD
ncbi:hypothetical protein [Kitasatospora sp. HPMI-4]|uniref:hypothetical protein n=1 Tax=Kitasatospora sp. HPMI-4 TaxID=3448443 RepID=UPI003F1DC849